MSYFGSTMTTAEEMRRIQELERDAERFRALAAVMAMESVGCDWPHIEGDIDANGKRFVGVVRPLHRYLTGVDLAAVADTLIAQKNNTKE